MFESIKKRWAEARADVAWKEADDILLRYNRMNPNSRYFLSSAFTSILSELEDQFGSMSEWSSDRKKAFAAEIMTSARKAFKTPGNNLHAETSRLGAHGGALLSLFLELQTLSGNQAQMAVETINKWRATL